MPGYKRLKNSGITFVFWNDEVDTELLHIYARHMCSTEDAINVFFDTEYYEWDPKFRRFESYTDTHGLYRFWMDEEKTTVMVISCFKR